LQHILKLTPTNYEEKQFCFKKSSVEYKLYHDKQQNSFTKHPAECSHEKVMKQDGNNETGNLESKRNDKQYISET